jgi:glycine cleavage system transcriptional repressor
MDDCRGGRVRAPVGRIDRREAGLTVHHVAVSAIGSDRPGIVAAVTGVLWERGCNLEDTSMSILRGHFAMMLVVAAPADMSARDLEDALTPTASAFELVLVVRPMDEDVPSPASGAPFTVSVYGADRPGIVHQLTSHLARAGINVVDLTTRVIGDPGRPVYAMFLDVTVPDGVDPDEVARDLERVATGLEVSCSMHAADADIL